MANQSTILIELKVDDKGSATIKQFGTDAKTSLEGAGTAATTTSDKMAGFKQSWTDLAVAGTAAWMLVSKAMVYMDQGAKALQVESSFKIMAESSGVMADSMIANMARATRGTIDDSDLMQKAIKLLTLGYEPSQIERFSEVVITASQIAGTTAVEAYDRLSDAIANRMPKALVQMGAVTKDQMKIVTTAIESGATQTDLLELALSNLELKHLMLKGTQDEASISMQRFHAQVSETGETLGKILIIGMREAYAVFQAFGVASLEVSSSIYKVLEARNDFAAAVHFGDAKKEYQDAAAAFKQMAEDDKAAAASLRTAMIDNFTGTSAAEEKATKQEIANAKKKVAAQMTVMAAMKDTAAAAKKAAEEREKAETSIIEAIRKTSYEAETIGQTQYEKDVARITSEAAKYTEAMGGKEISAKDFLLVAKYVAVEMGKADKLAYEEMAKNAREATEKAVSEIEKQIAAGVKLSEDHIKGAEEYRKLVAGEYEFAATENERQINTIIAQEGEKLLKIEELYNRGYISLDEVMTAAIRVHANSTAAILEKETENALKIAKLNSDLISGIRGWEKEAYNARIAEIDAKAAKDIKDGADYANVMARKKYDTETAYIEMGSRADGFFGGIEAGYLLMKRSATDFRDVGMETFKTFTDSSASAFGSNFRDILKGDFSNLGEAWKKVGENMLTTFTDNLGKMATQKITELMKPAWDAFSGMFTAAGSGIWDVLRSGYSSAVSAMGGTGILGYLSSGWNAFSSFFTAAGSGIWDVLKSGYSSAVSAMGGTGILGYLSTGWNAFTGFFTAAGSGIWDTLKNGYSTAVSAMGGTGILGYLSTGWNAFSSFFTAAGSGIWDVLKNGYSSAVSAMGGTGILGYLSTGWNAFSGFFTAAGTGIWSTLKSGYSGVISAIGGTNIVSSTWQSWSNFAGDAGKWFGSIWTNYTGLLGSMSGIDIKGWLRPAWDAFSSFFSNGSSGIWDTIKSGYNAVLTALGNSDISVKFVAAVSGAWDAVLGIINKAWDLAKTVNLFAEGGYVPGSAPYAGDNYGNDTVRALLSPGEYVMPRSAVNPETREILDYMRTHGSVPQYATGGYVNPYADYPQLDYGRYGTEGYSGYNLTGSELERLWTVLSRVGGAGGAMPATLRNPTQNEAIVYNTIVKGMTEPFDSDELNLHTPPQQVDPYGWTNGPYGTFWNIWTGRWTPPGGLPYKDTVGMPPVDRGPGGMAGFVNGLADFISSIPVVGNIMDAWDVLLTQTSLAGYAIREVGGLTPEEELTFRHTVGLAAATWGVGGALFGEATAAGEGGFTAEELALAYNGVNIAGEGTLGLGAGYKGTMTLWAWKLEHFIMSYLANMPTKFVKDFAVQSIGGMLNHAFNGEDAHGSLTLENVTGDFQNLIGGLGSIVPKNQTFSALNGLNYVPRDNFRINAHEGEAVLTKPQAEEWRGGKGGENTYNFNFTLNSTVTDTKTFKGFAKDIMREISHIEARQITVGAN